MRSTFLNKYFYWLLIILLIGVLLLNIIQAAIFKNLIGLIPISIQGLILILIITKSKYVKIGIISFSSIFFVLASVLQMLGRFIQDADSDFNNYDLFFYLKNMFFVGLGLIIILLSVKTIKISETNSLKI